MEASIYFHSDETPEGCDCDYTEKPSWNAITFRDGPHRNDFISWWSSIGSEHARAEESGCFSCWLWWAVSFIAHAALLWSAVSIFIAKTIITSSICRGCARLGVTKQNIKTLWKSFTQLRCCLLGDGECCCRDLHYIRVHLRCRLEVRGDYQQR